MKPTPKAFLLLFAIHSLVSIFACRYLATRTWTAIPVDSTSIEATTAGERARGQRTFFVTEYERLAVHVPWPVKLYIISGYAALFVVPGIRLFSFLKT
jgi:hypothetical protein